MLVQITATEWLNTDLIKKIQINQTKDSKVSEICIYMLEGPSMAWHSPRLLNKSVPETILKIKVAMESRNVYIVSDNQNAAKLCTCANR